MIPTEQVPAVSGDPCNKTYSATVALAGFLLGCVGVEVSGREHVPASGPCLVVCNHRSYFDPPILSWGAKHRTIFYMAKKELFETPLLGHYIKALHAFPVERGKPDRSAIRTSLDLLEAGRMVGIFPEGTRGQGEALGPFQEGFAILARMSGAPIVPACLVGGNWWKGNLSIRFGEPIDPSGVKGKVLVQQVRDSMLGLLGSELAPGS